MPRIRTTPQAIATATRDQLRFFGIEIGYSTDGTVLASQTTFTYGITNTDDAHNTLRQIREEIKWADLPQGVRTTLKSLYSSVLTDAQNKGHIGAGTDVGDIT
jgi:hypothetical protein